MPDDDSFYAHDKAFRVRRVIGAYRWQAVRMAVLTPILGDGWHDGVNDDALLECVQDALSDVRRRWRARLFALRDAGWLAVTRDGCEKEGMLRLMRNCPPFGCKTDVNTRQCRYPRVWLGASRLV